MLIMEFNLFPCSKLMLLVVSPFAFSPIKRKKHGKIRKPFPDQELGRGRPSEGKITTEGEECPERCRTDRHTAWIGQPLRVGSGPGKTDSSHGRRKFD